MYPLVRDTLRAFGPDAARWWIPTAAQKGRGVDLHGARAVACAGLGTA